MGVLVWYSAITGGCLGSGVGLLAGVGCGGIGAGAGNLVTQRMDTKNGTSASQVIANTVQGDVGGIVGGIGAPSINKGWLAPANRNPGGLSAKNSIPGVAGSLGKKLQQNTAVRAAWDFTINCVWGSL